MANTPYENFVLENEVEDQFNSHLNLERFCTIDRSLVGTPGMKKIIHTYSATDGTEKLAQGVGNTKSITAGFTENEYTILLAQNRFEYFDEELMKDPLLIQVGIRHGAVDMYNTVNADVFAEFNKATLSTAPTKFDFDAFVDAAAKLNVENLEGLEKFAFVSPTDMAEIRKNLKSDLMYVSEFSKRGYVGSVGDINLYTKADAVAGTIVMGTKDAVTLFVKKGAEVEQITKQMRGADDANIRKNSIFLRKYYLAALTDATKVVKMVKA